MSSTHIATRSRPIVSKRSAACATSAFVPTPSVDDTSTGCLYRSLSSANRPPKPPMSPMTSRRNVWRTRSLMRWTASSPFVIETPAASYVSPMSCLRLGQRDLHRVARRHVVLLEHGLVQSDGDLHRVVARE